MKMFIPTHPSVLLLLSLFTVSSQLAAQSSDEDKTITQWIQQSSYKVSHAGLDAPTDDLNPLGAMIGDARIVALSESLHSAAEPLAFRNRLFKYLVEGLEFKAIVLESGLVESRIMNDYVVNGEGDLESAIALGFSSGFDQFTQNRELIRWLRNHNAGLPDGAPKVQIFGMDVSGSPGNLAATRKPDTALLYLLEYLDEVDPEAAAEFHRRIDTYLPALASTNDYGPLPSSDRNELTSAIEDMVSLIERRRFDYVSRTSEYDHAWAERAAVSARQVDSWFRRMPAGWVLDDGFVWTAEAQIIRDRAMADNLDWVLSQLEPDDRVLAFASVAHIAATQYTAPDWMQVPEERFYVSTPFGAYARARHGSDFVNILNMLQEGEIYFCLNPEATTLDIGTPDESWAESLFASVGIDEYVIDLRKAPATVSSWLQQEHEHRNVRVATSDAFDIAYFVRRITSDCVAM